MRKWFLRLSCTVMVVLALAMGAVAGTTVKGPSGVLTLPTADALAAGDLSLSYHLEAGDGIGSLAYGLTDNIEVGLLTDTKGTDLGLHAKAVLSQEDSSLPGVAVGLCDDSLYMVASKRLASASVRGHVGVGTGDYNGLFLGVSKMLNAVTVDSGLKNTSMPATLLAVEYVRGGFNIGADVLLSPQVRIKVAAEDLKHVILGVSFKMSL
ncbi:MAG: YjbH domain-containing protein [Firmicutes bacterium]|nr:YjbH domain-containing protein [Bacillota bacterium]